VQTHLEPKQDHSEGQYSHVTVYPLVITGRHPAKLLQTVDQPLDLIPLPLELSVKRPSRMLGLLPRDHRSNASSLQVKRN
jgi:hypothetical protein